MFMLYIFFNILFKYKHDYVSLWKSWPLTCFCWVIWVLEINKFRHCILFFKTFYINLSTFDLFILLMNNLLMRSKFKFCKEITLNCTLSYHCDETFIFAQKNRSRDLSSLHFFNSVVIMFLFYDCSCFKYWSFSNKVFLKMGSLRKKKFKKNYAWI